MRSNPTVTANQSSHDERIYTWARHVVYERMALLTAVIWACGAFLLFVNLVPPDIARPAPQIMISMTIPIIPAALPWLFYTPISRAVARRRLATERSVMR